MATKKPAAKPAGKVFDIARPGKSAPSASAKPIIITNRPILQDPMMVTPAPASPDSSAPTTDNGAAKSDSRPDLTATPSSTKIKIAPLHTSDELEKSEAAEEAAAEVPPDSPTEPETQPDAKESDDKSKGSDSSPEIEPAGPAAEPAAADTTPESPEPAASAASSPDNESSAGDKPGPAPEPASSEDGSAEKDEESDKDPAKSAPADPTKGATDPKADEEAARKAAEHVAEINKLAESRKYYLPINQVEKRRNKRVALLGLVLIIILCLAWVNIALDAGILKLGGIHPVTHFFNK